MNLKEYEKQVINWEKIFVNHMSIKGLIFRIYKKSVQRKSIKTNYPITVNNFLISNGGRGINYLYLKK